MPRKKKLDEKLILRVPANATLKQCYAIARAQFTAEELQRYTELDEETMVPAEQVLAEARAFHAKQMAKKKRKS